MSSTRASSSSSPLDFMEELGIRTPAEKRQEAVQLIAKTLWRDFKGKTCKCKSGCKTRACPCRKDGYACSVTCHCMKAEAGGARCESPFKLLVDLFGGIRSESLSRIARAVDISLWYMIFSSRCDRLCATAANSCFFTYLGAGNEELNLQDLKNKMLANWEAAHGDEYLKSLKEIIDKEEDDDEKDVVWGFLFHYALGQRSGFDKEIFEIYAANPFMKPKRWSFCRNTWVHWLEVDHCKICNDGCLEDIWHCEKCGVCKIGRNFPCGECGSLWEAAEKPYTGDQVAVDVKPKSKKFSKRERRQTDAGEESSSAAGKRRAA